LALVVVLAALAASAGTAHATIEFTNAPGGTIEARSEGRLTFQAGVIRVTCRVVLRGRLLTTAIPATSGSKFGELTGARIEECEGGTLERALIGEREAWELKVSALLGSLPETITGLLFTINTAQLQFSLLGIRCLYSGIAGALLTLRRAEELGFTAGTGRFLESTYRLVSGAGCPESGTMRGSISFSPAQTLKMRAPLAVAVGDSYISGEAGRWAGNVNALANFAKIDALERVAYNDAFDRSGETIPLCHRSIEGEIQLGGGMWGKTLACSGAKTRSYKEGAIFKPGLDFANLEGDLGQAKLLQNYAEVHREIKLVTVSIGGNDFEFGWIVQQCLLDYLFSTHRLCSAMKAVNQRIEEGAIATNARAIAQSLINVREAMRNAGLREEQYAIVVQNYMSPIPKGREFRYETREGFEPREEEREAEWEETGPDEARYELEEEYYRRQIRQAVGGCGFYNADATWANEVALPKINRAIAEAIATSRVRVTAMRLESAFNGRRLCERRVGTLEEEGLASWMAAGAVDRTEWVSQIFLLNFGQFLQQESLHPNQWGERALRSCLRRTYNEGVPREGRCTIRETGLNERSEPQMDLR